MISFGFGSYSNQFYTLKILQLHYFLTPSTFTHLYRYTFLYEMLQKIHLPHSINFPPFNNSVDSFSCHRNSHHRYQPFYGTTAKPLLSSPLCSFVFPTSTKHPLLILTLHEKCLIQLNAQLNQPQKVKDPMWWLRRGIWSTAPFSHVMVCHATQKRVLSRSNNVVHHWPV